MNIIFNCAECDKSIIENSKDHDECICNEDGDRWWCDMCRNCDECKKNTKWCCDDEGSEMENEWEMWFGDDGIMAFDTKAEMKQHFDMCVSDLKRFGKISIECALNNRPEKISCYGDTEAEDWTYGEVEISEEEEDTFKCSVCYERWDNIDGVDCYFCDLPVCDDCMYSPDPDTMIDRCITCGDLVKK